MNYGITVDKQGNFTMNGKPFHGYGVNAYTMIYNRQLDPQDESYKDGFAMLKKYNIPFIRTPVTYEPVEYYEQYLKDPDAFFEGADKILEEARRSHIGVIVIIMNSSRYSSMLGEKPSAVHELNSRSMAYQKKLAADFVNRYKDNPAVWGWEIRNEGNLEADLFRTAYGNYHQDVYGLQVGEFNGYDSVTSAEMSLYKREIAKVVRELDPYRLISSGDAVMRECAYHLHQASMQMDDQHCWTENWTPDTLEEFREIIRYSTPDPVDTVSTHLAMPAADFLYRLSGADLSYEELIKEYVSVAKAAKKGFYYGEFGDVDKNENNLQLVTEQIQRNLRIMVESGVQLATLWQFNGDNNAFNDEGKMGCMFREISKVNDWFQKSGLQDMTDVW